MDHFLMKENLTLEDAFFLKEDKILIEKLKEMAKLKRNKEEYSRVSGITNDHVLQKFIDLDIPVDIVACLAVVPLIKVAWADGHIDEKEKEIILTNTKNLNMPQGGIEFELIAQWLEHPPESKLLDAWYNYVHGVCEKMGLQEKEEFKQEILKHAYSVAQASGGFFGTGLGNKISKKENEIIKQLEAAFK